MKVEDPKVYPLEGILSFIPDDGVRLDRNSLTIFGTYMQTGGVICESYNEVIMALKYLADWTKLISLHTDDGETITVRKTNGK